MLDWVEQSSFPDEISAMLAPTGAVVAAQDTWLPTGASAPAEARLETFGPQTLPETVDWDQLRTWWLAHERGANTPNWDLAATCTMRGRPGLVLVEAKANIPEMSRAGKSVSPKRSEASAQNHVRIGKAIEEARLRLSAAHPGTTISQDSHYQLANRVAFAWKLATLGLPTVLVYLGFTGDTGIIDAGEPFRNSAHWHSVFTDYRRGVLPDSMVGTEVNCGPASFWLLVRDRPVRRPSPRRDPRAASANAQQASE